MLRLLRKIKGFTLLELVIVVILIAMLSVFGSRMISSIFNVLYTGQNVVSLDWQAQIALERMTRDIRAIPSASSISNTSTASQFVFTDSSGTTNTYRLSGTQILLNTQVLIDGVSSLAFTYYDKNGSTIAPPPTASTRYILITLGLNQNNISYSITTAVYPWNLR